MNTNLILIASMALALGGCNRHDADNQSQYTHLTGTETALITPPASFDRGPVAPNANTAAPGTDASAAFAVRPEGESGKLPPNKVAVSMEQHVEVAAQDAAAKAPDTATADAEKRRVAEEFANAEPAAPKADIVATAPVNAPSLQRESPPEQ